jgi:hypothetical protein
VYTRHIGYTFLREKRQSLSRGIRDWDLPESVWLNPEKDIGDLEVAA